MTTPARSRRTILLTSIAIILPLLIAVGLLLVQKRSSGTSGEKDATSALFKEALARYQAKDYAGASTLINPHEEALTQHPEGCELMISVYAEAKEFVRLTAVSRRCIEQKRSDGISYEGLAHGLSSQGKIDEAIAALKEELQKNSENPRLAIALARLLVMVARDEEAGELFLGVISREESWSMWFAETLKQKVLLENKNFVAKLGALVVKKEKVFKQLEKQLQDAAAKLTLPTLVQQLAARQKGPP